MTGSSPRPQRPRLIFGILSLANVTYATSQTLVVPSIPAIQRHMHTTPAGATAVVSVFFISGAVSAGVLGRLGDIFGKQRILTAQLCCFTAGALLCAVAPTLPLLIAGRAVMGIAAALFPLTASIVRDELGGRWLTHGIAFLGAMIGIGASIGLACGGLVVDYLGYRWIFWIPVAMGLLSVVAVAVLVPESTVRSPGRVDYRGAVILAFGLAAPLVAISRASVWGWTGTTTLTLFAVGLALLAALVAYERRQPEPLLDVRALARPQVALTNLATFLVGFGVFGASVILTQFFQEPKSTGYGFGASATRAGLFLVPGTVLMLVLAPLSGRISLRHGPKVTLLGGSAISAAALAGMAAVHDGEVPFYAWPTLMYIGIGFALAAMPMLILGMVAPGDRGQATAVNQTFRLIGSSLGTQLAATFVAASVGRSGLPAESGFVHAFVVEALGAACAFVVALAIPVDRAARWRRGGTDPTEAVAAASELS